MGPTEGLFTGRFIAEEVPPPGVELTAVNASDPAAETSDELRVALTWVALM